MNHAEVITWPTEKQNNPAISDIRKKCDDFCKIEKGDFKPNEIFSGSHCRYFRKLIFDVVKIQPEETFEQDGYISIWLTKYCNVGCEFCFYRSPKHTRKDKEGNITRDGVQKIIQFINSSNISEILLSGGGEPFLRFESICQIIENLKHGKIAIATSADWASNQEKAAQKLSKLHEIISSNQNYIEVTLRLSVDRYHADRLDYDLSNVINVIRIFESNQQFGKSLKFALRSITHDSTIDRLLNLLDVSQIQRKSKTELFITLKSGLIIPVKFRTPYNVDNQANLNNKALTQKQIKVWEKDVTQNYGGNLSAVKRAKGKGLNLTIQYDGSLFLWGGNSPDNEMNIYEHDYETFHSESLRDIITISFLERGNHFRDSIINEVNPKAIQRAKAIGLRDFYGRVCFEEERTRLYFVIRAIQEYCREGRISKAEFQDYPLIIQNVLSLPKDELIRLYHLSENTIVNQYLNNPTLTLNQLINLYKLVVLGHYDMMPEEMRKIIFFSNKISPDLKNAFFNYVSKR